MSTQAEVFFRDAVTGRPIPVSSANPLPTTAGVGGGTSISTKFAVNVGDGAATQFDVTHNMGSQDIVVGVWEVASGRMIECDVTSLSNTVVRLNLAAAPAANALRVVVVG